MHFYDWLGGCHSTTDPRYRHIAEDRTIAYFLEQGYLPSATTTLSVLRHAYLEKHKIKLALDHYKLTQNYQESVEYRDEYRDQSATAKGTRLHKLCETLFQTFVSDRNILYSGRRNRRRNSNFKPPAPMGKSRSPRGRIYGAHLRLFRGRVRRHG